MKHSPITRSARAMLSLLVVFAWLHAANHCAVAGLLPKAPAAPAAHEGCPGHPAPGDDNKSDGCDGSSCCKSLVAPQAIAKSMLEYDGLFFVAKNFPVVATVDLGEQHVALIAEVDTGPPGSPSFAESVLQRSLLAHAPPLFV